MTKEEVIRILKDSDLNDELEDYEVLDIIEEHTSEEVNAVAGCSKMCIIFKNFPYVIKYSHNIYGDKIEGAGEAEKEIEIYTAAKMAGVERFFPKTEIFCTINGILFVAQEKIDYPTTKVPNKKRTKYLRISKTTKYKIFNKMQNEIYKVPGSRSLDRLWAGVALSLYGKKLCKKLCDFIVTYQINDLHGNNIGYKDDKPILLDFSGYSRSSY